MVFQIQMRHHQHLILRNWIHAVPLPKSCFIHPQWKRVKGEHRIKIRDASLDRQPKVQSSSVEETLQRIMVQTNNDCRFQIFISTNSYTSHVCLLEDKIQDWGMYLFTIFLRKLYNGSLENTPAVSSLGKLCDENGYSYEWINGQKPHLIKDGNSDYLQHRELRFRSWFQACQVRPLDLHQLYEHPWNRIVILLHPLHPHLLHLQ